MLALRSRHVSDGQRNDQCTKLLALSAGDVSDRVRDGGRGQLLAVCTGGVWHWIGDDKPRKLYTVQCRKLPDRFGLCKRDRLHVLRSGNVCIRSRPGKQPGLRFLWSWNVSNRIRHADSVKLLVVRARIISDWQGNDVRDKLYPV